MDSCSQGNINISKTFIISSTPVVPVLPCSAVTTNIMFSCDGSNTFTFSGNTITPHKSIIPNVDNTLDIGNASKRFRNINTVSGASTVWTSTIQIITPEVNLGYDITNNERIIDANNSIISGDILIGGIY
jgi:hypothetical protein